MISPQEAIDLLVAVKPLLDNLIIKRMRHPTSILEKETLEGIKQVFLTYGHDKEMLYAVVASQPRGDPPFPVSPEVGLNYNGAENGSDPLLLK